MPRNPDIHEGFCKRCNHRYYRDLTYVYRKNASEEAVFAQVTAIIRPYCSWRCIPGKLKDRIKWLIDNPLTGLAFSLPVPDPLEEGVLDDTRDAGDKCAATEESKPCIRIKRK